MLGYSNFNRALWGNPTQTTWLRMQRGEVPKGKIKAPQYEKLGVDIGEASSNVPHNQPVSKVVTLSCLTCGGSTEELLNSLVPSTISHKINFNPPRELS